MSASDKFVSYADAAAILEQTWTASVSMISQHLKLMKGVSFLYLWSIFALVFPRLVFTYKIRRIQSTEVSSHVEQYVCAILSAPRAAHLGAALQHP